MGRDRLIQLAFLTVAAAALVGAALLQRPIEQARLDNGMDILGRESGPAKDPRIAIVQRVPGGLRAPLINYVWIRSQSLKQEGKFFDARGLRDLICEMLPHHIGVWGFCAWDMAWNISVATHTPAERWMWVSNGMELLRDKGLVYNPEELILYRELAWIYFSKCGQYTDEMHRVYKRRWAEEMDWVVGSPPSGDAARAVAAFRLIAEAPASEEALLSDAAVADLVGRLAGLKVAPGAAFLRYYNRFSLDPMVGELDTSPRAPREGDSREARIYDLMRSTDLAGPLAKVLAFSRRKVLEKTYRLDTRWMLALMEKYGPFEWRHVDSHAVYWCTYGLHRARGLTLEEIRPGEAEAKIERFKKLSPDQVEAGDYDLARIDRLNAERIVLGALKSLTKTGQLFVERGGSGGDGDGAVLALAWAPDWRFIEPTHREYVAGGLSQVGDSKEGLADDDNDLADGHVTYLEDVILQLYFARRESQAQRYYDEVRARLKPNKKIYEGDPTLHDFVRAKIVDLRLPPADLAATFWSGALRAAYLSLAQGRTKDFGLFRSFALRAHSVYVRDVSHAPRLKPPSFARAELSVLTTLFTRPESMGVKVSLLAKSRLYKLLGGIQLRIRPQLITMQHAVYDAIAEPLRRQCREEGISFDLAFPAPPKIEAATAAQPEK